jgi:copper chaperone CopZ
MKKPFFITLLTITTLLFLEAFESDININVKGLVCDFCARSVEKTFGKLEAVSDVAVDLEQGVISLEIKDTHNLSDAEIEKLVKANGFSLESIKRNP